MSKRSSTTTTTAAKPLTYTALKTAANDIGKNDANTHHVYSTNSFLTAALATSCETRQELPALGNLNLNSGPVDHDHGYPSRYRNTGTGTASAFRPNTGTGTASAFRMPVAEVQPAFTTMSTLSDNPNFRANWLQLVRDIPSSLRSAPDVIRNDYDVVHTAVARNGLVLVYASDIMRAREGIVEAALLQNPHALQFADDVLKADYGFMRNAVRTHFESMMYVSDQLRNNINFIVEVVGINGSVLAMIPDEMQNNDEVVLAAASALISPAKEKWAAALVILGTRAMAWDTSNSTLITTILNNATIPHSLGTTLTTNQRQFITARCSEYKAIIEAAGRLQYILDEELNYIGDDVTHGFILDTPGDLFSPSSNQTKRQLLTHWVAKLNTTPTSVTLKEAEGVALTIIQFMTEPRINPVNNQMEPPPCEMFYFHEMDL